MKNFLKLSILIFFLTLLFQTPSAWSEKTGKYFSVGIEQDGKSIPIKDHEVILKKKPFTLLFTFPKIDDINIAVNVSEKAESYEAAKSGNPVKEIKGFDEMFGMAEYRFNKSRTLMLSETASHYWYYIKDNDHRFDEVYPSDGKWICKRMTANLMDRDTGRTYKDIENFPGEALYFVFLKGTITDDYKEIIEKQRDYLKIIFKN